MSDETSDTPAEPDEAPTTPAATEEPTEAVTTADDAAADDATGDAAGDTEDASSGDGERDGATPAPAPVAAATGSERGRGVFVPAWVAIVAGVFVVAGLGFLIGWIAAPDDSSPSIASATAPNGQNLPNLPGNGQNLPNFPGNGNDRGNGNANGNGSSGDDADDRVTPPLGGSAFLGVAVESAADDDGATVTSVADGSPAADGGLKEGDVVTAVDGESVTSALDLVRLIRQHEADDTVTITYTRDGTQAEAKITLEARSASSVS